MQNRYIFESVIILIFSVGVSLIFNGLRHGGIHLLSSQHDQTNPDGHPRQLPFDEAIRLYHDNKALFIDARPASTYEEEHIKGAFNYPEQEMDTWINDFFEKVDPDTTIITYCDGSHCNLAEHLAEKLTLAGYSNVYFITNGLGNWIDKNLPTEGTRNR